MKKVFLLQLFLLVFVMTSCDSAQKPVWRWLLHSRSYAVPMIEGDSLYIVSQAGEVICGNYRTGEKRWSRRVQGQILAAPALSSEYLFAATDLGYLYAIQKPSGTIVWTKNLSDPVIAPLAYSHGMVLVPSVRGVLYAISPSDGSQIWSVPGNQKYNAGIVANGSYLFAGGWANNLLCLRPDGSLNWQFKAAYRLTEAPVIDKNLIFLPAYDGYVYSLEAPSGKLRWQFPARFPTNVIVIDHDVVFASEGSLYVVRSDSGKLLSKISVNRPVSHLYSWSNRCLFVSGQVYDLDVKTGKMERLLPLQDSVFKMAFPPGIFLVTDEGNTISAYRAK